MRDSRVGLDIVKGAIAGAAATWLMGQLTTWMYECEDRQARERENRASPRGLGGHLTSD